MKKNNSSILCLNHSHFSSQNCGGIALPDWQKTCVAINIKLNSNLIKSLYEKLQPIPVIVFLLLISIVFLIKFLPDSFGNIDIPIISLLSGCLFLFYYFSVNTFTSCHLSFVDAGTRLPKTNDSLLKKNTLYLAIRTTHPDNRPKINAKTVTLVKWLNEPKQFSLKHQILLTSIWCLFNNAKENYWDQIRIALLISRTQVLLLLMLFLALGLADAYYCSNTPNTIKLLFSLCGLLWLIYAIYLYTVQVHNLSLTMNKSKEYSIDKLLPIFHYNSLQNNWSEVQIEDIYDSNFIENYGLATEKMSQIALTLVASFYTIAIQLI